MNTWFTHKRPSLAKIPGSLVGAVLLFGQGLAPAPGLAQRMPGGPTPSAPLSQSVSIPPSQPYRPLSPAALPPQQPEGPYTLGAGDRVQMVLFRLPQYSGEFEVQVDGSLSLPLVGNVDIGDLTLQQASATISQRYSQYLRRPEVSLNLIARRPLIVGIAGEINRPGAYPLAIEGTSFPKLTQLFEVAGGITQSANLREVQIQRQVNGRTQTFTANLWDLINTGNLNQDVVLRDGDSIFIPSTLVPLDEGPILAAARFSPDSSVPINISVVGEVFRPGPYSLRGGTTRTGDAGLPGAQVGISGSNVVFTPVKVSDALQIAGGIKPRANIRQVQIRRVTRSGGEQVFTVDLWSLLQTGETRQNAILQEGDTVFIPTATAAITPEEVTQVAGASFSPNTIRINVVGEVQRGGQVAVAPNTTLNQGILAAGGFTPRAQQDVVGLVRLNPDGSVTQREIPVNFAQGIDEENNPVLQNDDIIIVGKSGLAQFSDNVGLVANPIGGILNILTAPFRFLNLF
ncbi:sugar ABC transporter substrate-binding protein [filamentous cyanobacterium CCP3]|nr:sugar ABC transporter substrate-binding protein [filamentous cyanobacterium CCP3]